MSAGHTPGPWHNLDIGEIVPSDADGLPDDDFRICFMVTPGGDPTAADRIEANARLIAAAPDLVEALQEARSALHQHYVEWDGEPEDAVPLLLARANCDDALSKALGTNPTGEVA